VVADLELEAVEQFALDVLGQPAEISFDDRQPVKQARIAHGGRFRAPGQVGELDFQVLPLRCDLGEAFAELAAPLLVNVFVIGRPVVAKHRTSRTEPLVQAPMARRPRPRIGSGGG
jgi:hypothetical protein